MPLPKCTRKKIANVLGDLLELLWYLSAKDASAIMAPSIAHVFRIKKRFACILIDLPEHVEDIIASINWARQKQRIFREFLKRNKRIAAIFCVISIMGGRK